MNTIRSFFRIRSTPLVVCTFLTLLCPIASGCDESSPGIESGQVLLSLAAIPDNVSCVRVTATGEFRSAVTDFDVVPGEALTEALTGLPVGSVVFSANAYAGACSTVTKSTAPLWLSDEKTVTIVQGKSTSVTLTLYKNGRAKVTVEFADQEDGGAGGGTADGGTRG